MNGEFFKVADAAAFVEAIDKELGERARTNVERVNKGRLTQREADYVNALLRDMRSDLAHAFSALPGHGSVERADPAVPWAAKVRWIKGEIEQRRDTYPELVGKGRMTEADAKLKLRMIETLQRLYWRELFMWEPEPGPAREWLRALRVAKLGDDFDAIDRAIPGGRRLKMELVRKHMAALELEEGKAQGELVSA